MEIGELKKLFDDMTIEEKAGQLFQTVGAMYDDEAVISGPMQEMGITEKDIQLAVHIPQELRIRSRGTERHSASN